MQGFSGEALGPLIKIHGGEQVYRPYQELKERLGPEKYDAVIVFGEGPVRRVFFSDQWDKIRTLYTPEQIQRWEESADMGEFKKLQDPREKIAWLETKGPRTKKEPDFTVVDINPHGPSESTPGIDINPYFERMKKIEAEGNPERREEMREEFRGELENMARHAYKRYGELNALAAGLLLYTGKTDKIILSGGRTISQDKIQQGLGFPSESELMRDLIIRIYGRKMYERDKPRVDYEEYKKSVFMQYSVIEDSATNTIDNIIIIRSINHTPGIFFNTEKTPEIGLLGNNHQVERTVILLNLFTDNEKGARAISAQKDVLKPFADIRNKSGNKKFFPELLRYMTDEPTNVDLQDKTKGEEKAFQILGLDFDHFANINFTQNPGEMTKLKTGLAKILANNGQLRNQKLERS